MNSTFIFNNIHVYRNTYMCTKTMKTEIIKLKKSRKCYMGRCEGGNGRKKSVFNME